MRSEADMEELIRKNWKEDDKYLNLSSDLKAYSAQELEQLLRIIAAQKPHVEKLDLSGNGIGDEGARRVADALPSLRHLKKLWLENNGIGDEGARRVADALPSLRHLKELTLENNKFGKDGAATIAEAALPFLGELEVLYLTGHPKEVDWGARGWVQGMPSAALGAAVDEDDGDWNWAPMLAVIRRMANDTPELLPQRVRERLTGNAAPSEAERVQEAVGRLSLGAGGGRTLAGSNFRAVYEHAVAAEDDIALLGVMKEFLKEYCKLRQLSPDQGMQLLTAVRTEANAKSADWFTEGLTDVTGMAQRLWSSTSRGWADRELCSLLNEALRSDEPALMRPLAVFARTINQGLINRRGLTDPKSWPPDNETYRGAVLPPEHLEWYQRMQGRQYRVPGFLATSFSQDTAEKFAWWAWEASDKEKKYEPAVLYTIKLDRRGKTSEVRRCKHVSLIRKSNVDSESEFLYVPYSTFTVLEVRVSAKPNYLDPHVVVLESSIDNRVEPEDLPLAPWY